MNIGEIARRAGVSSSAVSTAHPHGTCGVDVDYAALVARCVHHLADLGDRSIALLNRSVELVAAGYGPARRAQAGFAEAVLHRGLTGIELPCADNPAAGEECLEQLRDTGPTRTS